MNIQTSSGNVYSYLRRTNEIVGGVVNDSDFEWHFAPLHTFSVMPEVDMFIVGITEQCNLRCSYCCYSGEYRNNRTHGNRTLTSDDIDEIYDFIIRVSNKKHIRIAFYGGEPLLQYSLIQYAITQGRERVDKCFDFSISTNGTLLTKDKIDWLVQNKVELAISIDGTRIFHDAHRVDALGIGSYDKVYEVLSYIRQSYPEYAQSVVLQMTLSSYRDVVQIAKEWSNDKLLRDFSPANIHGLSPNFSNSVKLLNYEEVKELYTHILDNYEAHKDWGVLKVLLNECIAYWKDRPIVDAGLSVPMATCMPVNTKLYIDSRKDIGICEKVADKYRIGNVKYGIDWERANELVEEYYKRRKERCKYCPAIRMCDMCLTAMEYSDEEWDVLCQNEQVYAKVFMFLYCEMAERGLIE